ncbi:MAG: aldehyde dehydrogenase (NADP(+)) [Balneolaceae bacterium]|nr:aldehyde dehydrogenase (NADP(+)) [Balneolaceae bacterium]
MIKGTNFIGSETSSEGTEVLQATNPQDNQKLPETFAVATEAEIQRAMEKAQAAFLEYRNYSGKQKATFLDAIADEIMGLEDELIHRASAETGLPNGRFEGERGRTCNQLRMFADLLREGSWVDARIDTAQPDREPIPKADIRRMLFPLGPVVVFGASNFPLAFSTAGGDTASALAAGCPVIVKSHESHPGTNELVSRAILSAAEKTAMPCGVFSSLNGGPETGQKLVQHPTAKAVGFTGSFGGGKAIYDLAQQREEPIPVYAEMGSINPVFLLDEKLENSAEELAKQYAGSVTLGVGQFCTNPGILVAQAGEALNRFSTALAEELSDYEPACMLNSKIADSYRGHRSELLEQEGVKALCTPSSETGTLGGAAVATVSGEDFLKNEALHREVFGPSTLIVFCADETQRLQIAQQLEGQLTITFMGNDKELTAREELINICREKAGRIIFNGVPTGVEVCDSMHHGGPFPATTNGMYTSVGTAAVERFVRPIAFQDCPDDLLPDELQDENPLDILRMVDGVQTTKKIG